MRALIAFVVVFCAACVSAPEQKTPVLPDLAGKTVNVWVMAGLEEYDATPVGPNKDGVRKDPSPIRSILWKVRVDNPMTLITYRDLLAALCQQHNVVAKFSGVARNGFRYSDADGDFEPLGLLNQPITWKVQEEGNVIDLITKIPRHTLELVSTTFIRVKEEEWR